MYSIRIYNKILIFVPLKYLNGELLYKETGIQVNLWQQFSWIQQKIPLTVSETDTFENK